MTTQSTTLSNNDSPTSKSYFDFDLLISIVLCLLAVAVGSYGYKWHFEMRCENAYPWWMWVLGSIIILTRYVRRCWPWLFVVLVWTIVILSTAKDDIGNCEPEHTSSPFDAIQTTYYRITQSLDQNLSFDRDAQIVSSQILADGVGGRISIDQALSKPGKYFTCSSSTVGQAPPIYNIYFGDKALFNENDTEISGSAIPHLNKLAILLKAHPEDKIVITGHADKTGTAEGNQRLSQQRAYALEDWLIKNSITTRDKIDTQGAGDLYPIAASSASSSLNRRVEVRIDCSGNKTQ